ncbi:MAG TPA: EscU/YscU/HrcU family type III secretion system export apparatus switch protein [Stellaceae bacterium]
MTDRRSAPSTTPPAPAIAVALHHDRAAGGAPTIVASGRGAVAERILEIAFASGVKVREDADLAALLETVELGAAIPLEAFAAVAEVLAYLYRANDAMASGGGGRT